MKFLDELKQGLFPVADNLNKTIMSAAVIVNHKLDLIHRAASDLGRPDVGDYQNRFNFKKNFAGAETVELFEVPPNEIWPIEALVVDGTQEKSPAFIITIDNSSLVFSVIKEGLGTETIGGDITLGRGESLFVTSRGSGVVSFTMHMIRRRIPSVKHQDLTGEPGGVLEPVNTHEPTRDLIATPTGEWRETLPEVTEVGT